MPENPAEQLELPNLDERERDQLLPSEVIVAILLTTAAIFATFTSWTSALLDVELVDFEGLVALVNREQNTIISEARAYRDYTIYTEYELYNTIAETYDTIITDPDDPTQADLVLEQANAARLAERNRFFFSGEYLTTDGDFDREREVSALLAELDRSAETDPAPAFEEADQNRAEIRIYDRILIVLGISLSLYAISEVFHPSRRLIRYTLIGVGVVLFVGSLIVTFLVRSGTGLSALGL